jgi:hypothetical protein
LAAETETIEFYTDGQNFSVLRSYFLFTRCFELATQVYINSVLCVGGPLFVLNFVG